MLRIPQTTFSARPLLALFPKSHGGEDFALASDLAAHFSTVVAPSPARDCPVANLEKPQPNCLVC
jgi:hypothetical protein